MKTYIKPRLTRIERPPIITLNNGRKPWGSFPCHPGHGPHHHRHGMFRSLIDWFKT